MRTFGELLTEYTRRTGISDSELARTLGVSRQTVFRWKEGLTARPRVREDVLRCAERLRLAAGERDELLMAAGFAPENPALAKTIIPPLNGATAGPTPTEAQDNPADSPPPSTPIAPAPDLPQLPAGTSMVQVPEIPQTASVTPPLPVEIAPASPVAFDATLARARFRLVPRSLQRPWPRIWVLIGALAVVAVAGIFWFVYQQANPNTGVRLPVAAQGETLIVLGQLGQAAPSYDTTSELRAALEREIQAVRLTDTRVAVVSAEIKDANTAGSIQQRTRATLLLWGNQTNGQVTAHLTFLSMPAAKESPLGARVVAPDSNVTTTINATSTDEVRALALLTLAQVFLNRGDLAQARAEVVQALSRPPAQPDAAAALNFYAGYAYQASGEPQSSLEFYARAIDLAPARTSLYMNRGLAYVQLNQTQAWQEDFARVLTLQPNDWSAQLALCWAYALDDKPNDALPHCDEAVRQDAGAQSRDARGVVYAELQRAPDAVAEFQAFLTWLQKQPESLRTRYSPTRTAWIQSLQGGTNPFDPPTLEKLRKE